MYRESEEPKTSYILEKTLVLFIICSKCKEAITISKTLGLIENI